MTTGPDSPPPADQARRLTVLLGDERDAGEPWHRTAVGLLGAQGVETVVAGSGRDAMARIERGLTGGGPRIHVAVLEHRMPDMTGLQLLRRLAEELGRAGVPEAPPPTILLAPGDDRAGRGVSGNLMHDALAVRVFSVLPRPVQTDLLLDTLARALRRHYFNKWPGRS